MTCFADIEEGGRGAVFLWVEEVGTVEAMLVRDDTPC